MSHTVKLANGELLTGQSWRKGNSLFLNMPFTTSVVQADKMSDALEIILGQANVDSQIKAALIVCAKTHVSSFCDVTPLFSEDGR